MNKIIIFTLVLVSVTLNAQEDIFNIDEDVTRYEQIKSETNIDSTDKEFFNFLQNLYNETLQSDTNKLTKETLEEYNKFRNNRKKTNWNLFYLFDQFQNNVSKSMDNPRSVNPKLQQWLIFKLYNELLDLYGEAPTIIAVYMGENLLSTGQTDRAKIHFEQFLTLFPESVALKVNLYHIENDPQKKSKIYKELKEDFPNHWMVKPLIEPN